MKKKLHIGCGTNIKKGWINLDSAKLKGVDVVHNIEKFPWPFKDEEIDEILAEYILEHVDFIPVMKEMHRILKKGGKLDILVPHYTTRNNYIDPTHKRTFSIRTFDFFIKNSPFGRDYYFDFKFEKIIYSRIIFEKGPFLYNYIIEPIINLFPGMRNLYEATFLCYLFPSVGIHFIIKK